MSDSIWTSLISGITAVAGVFLGFLFTSRTNAKAARLAERQAQTKWERDETTRHERQAREDRHRQEEYRRSDARYREEIERAQAQRREEQMLARLQEMWLHVLHAEAGMRLLLRHSHREVMPEPLPVQDQPSTAVMRARAVAVLGLSDAYPLTQSLYEAAVKAETAISSSDWESSRGLAKRWYELFRDLEKQTAKQTYVIPADSGV